MGCIHVCVRGINRDILCISVYCRKEVLKFGRTETAGPPVSTPYAYYVLAISTLRSYHAYYAQRSSIRKWIYRASQKGSHSSEATRKSQPGHEVKESWWYDDVLELLAMHGSMHMRYEHVKHTFARGRKLIVNLLGLYCSTLHTIMNEGINILLPYF